MNQKDLVTSRNNILLLLKKLRILSLILWMFFNLMFLFISLFLVKDLLDIFLGFSFGFLVAILNLQLLGYSFLPIITTGENGIYAIVGGIFSFCLLVFFTFLVSLFNEKILLSFAVGLTGIILVGIAFKCIKLKKEEKYLKIRS